MLAALLLAGTVASAEHVRELIDKDQWQQALTEAQTLVAEAPDAESRGVLGEALYRAGRIDEAGEALAPIVTGDDAAGRALACLGLIRAAQGKDDEAARLMERAVAKSPRDPWVLFRASGAAPTRATAVAWLESYLETGESDDRDRREGAAGTIRTYKALGERKVWVPTARPERLELPLTPLPGTGGGYVVEATLANKKKIRLLLDTGSTGLFVVLRAVKKGGLTLLSDETVFAGGDTGRTASSRGLLPKLAFGELTFADALLTTTTNEFDPQGRIHGVVGLNVFAGYRVTLDLPHQKLVLAPCADDVKGTAYWDVGGQMLVSAQLSAGRDGLFLLDTGAVRSMVGRQLAETLPGATIEGAARVHTYGGNIAGTSSVRGVTLRFLDLAGDPSLVYASDLTQRSRLGGVEVSGFLGMDVLDRSTIVVDTRAHRVAVVAPAKNSR